MEPRGRGRARGGRAKPPDSQPQASRPGAGPPQQRPQTGGPGPGGRPQTGGPGLGGPPSAWGRPPPQGAVPKQPQPAAQMMGRGSRQLEEVGPATVEPRVVAGAAGDSATTARGGGSAVRGRTNRNEVINTRPASLQSKLGSSGRPVELTANFFKLVQHGTWCLFHYHVDFSPEVDNTIVKRGLMRTALKDKISGYIFDGAALYSPRRFQPDPMELVAQNKAGENIRMTIRLVEDLKWGDYHYIQIFNLIIRRCLRILGLQLIGRNYYDPKAKIQIPEYKLELWPGYFTSIRQHEKDIFLNAELQFKVMRTDNVYDLFCEAQQDRRDRNAFNSRIIGSVILTYYNNKTYRIDDVDYNTTPRSTFPMRDGSQISYIEYFQKKYNLNIQDPNQPMLISRAKEREIRAGSAETIYLVPEFCVLTGLTDEQRNNFQLMSALANYTRVGAQKRMEKLQEFANKLCRNPEILEEIKGWDLKFSEKLIQFRGRELVPEKISLGGQMVPSGPKADWTREFRNNNMFHAVNMDKFAVLTPQKFERQTEEFMKSLTMAAKGMNWNLAKYKIFTIRDDRSASYLDMLEEIISKNNPTLIMSILQGKSSDKYNAIKKKCYVDRGVPSQCVVSRNLTSKGVMSIATKIAIQLNCKIGGAPWSVAMPLKSIMIVGYDVCRDTANKSKSFGGMVASINSSITRYFCSASEHQYEEELSNNFGSFLILACYKFKEANGAFPEKILIYRDGVGDGQLPYVFNHEVENIKRKLESEIYTSTPLKMAFIVVSKRINTRIFGPEGNPRPGTVVDDVITMPDRYDFFIVSQCVNQGTVAPTSYNVIFDTMGLPPDRMQMLTYKLCHMYYNWSGTVRVPAPCQYAHKQAFLVAQNLHRPAHKNLETLLYFL